MPTRSAVRKTVILATHNMDEAERTADRVGIVDHGSLLALDTPEALRKSAGQGDTVAMRLEGGPGAVEAAKAALPPMPAGVQVGSSGDTLILHAPDAATLLPSLLESLAAAGIHCADVRLRRNSLEDAFIQLTGRRLHD